MQTDLPTGTRSAWHGWAETLQRYGLKDLAVWLLEAAGPLTVLGAQLVYIGGSFLHPALSNIQRQDLADMLENPQEALAFAAFLQEDISV